MFRRFLVSPLLLFFLLTQISHAVVDTPWQAIGPDGGTVFSIKRSTHSPAVLYIGMHFGGIYRSTDHGITWNHLESPLSESSVLSIAIDPADPNTIYASSYQGNVYKTTDEGITWLPVSNGLESEDIIVLAINPFDRLHLLAASANRLYVSKDGAATWQIVSTGVTGGVTDVEFAPYQPGIAYLATQSEGVKLSTNAGDTWQDHSSGLPVQRIAAVDFSLSGAEVFASSNNRIFRLLSDSTSWEEITFNIESTLVKQIVQHPTSGKLYAVAFDEIENPNAGIYVSNGYATTFDAWEKWDDLSTRFISIDPSGSVIHVARAIGKVEITVDDGANFLPVHAGLQNVFVGTLTTNQRNGESMIWSGTDLGIKYTSSDWMNGNNYIWAQSNIEQKPFSLAVNPDKPWEIYSGTETAGVWRSQNWGTAWLQTSTGMVPNRIFSIEQSSLGNNPLYAGTSNGIFVSKDNGQNWRKGTQAAFPIQVFSVGVDPVSPGVAYFGASNGEIFATLDGGNGIFRLETNGLPQNENITDIKVVGWNNLYAISSSGTPYASDSQRLNWFPIDSGLSHPANDLEFAPTSPWHVYLGTLGDGVHFSASGGIEWTPRNNGLDNPFVMSLLMDPDNESTLFAGTSNGLYKSNDRAENWAKVGVGLPQAAIMQLEADPLNGQILYAGIPDHGVFKSVDGGTNWNKISSGTHFTDHLPISVSAVDSNLVFVGTHIKGIQSTNDGGTSWTASSQGMSLFVRGLAFDPSDSNTMYASSLTNGIFKTTDNAANWTYSGLSGTSLFDIAVDYVDPQRVFVATSDGVSRTLDGGNSWQNLGAKTKYAFSLATDPINNDIVYLGGLSGFLYYSEDGGQIWEKRNMGLPQTNILSLTINPATGDLFAGLEKKGIYKSTDKGLTWSRSSMGLPDDLQITHMYFDQYGQLLAGSEGGWALWSPNNGADWVELSAGLLSPIVTQVMRDPQNGALYATTLDGTEGNPAFYRFDYASNQWIPKAAGLNSNLIYSMAAETAQAGHLYIASANGLFKTLDGGDSWTKLTDIPGGSEVTRLLLDDRGASSALYAGTTSEGVFVSHDAGQSWSLANQGLENANIYSIKAFGNNPGHLRVASLGEGFKTTLTGTEWGPDQDHNLISPLVLSVATNPESPDVIYAGTGGSGIMKSQDGGITWLAVNQGLDSLFVFEIVVDPVTPDIVYAATALGGVFISENGGSTWDPLNTGLFHKNITSLALDAVNPKTIYAGTEGGGIFMNNRP